MTWPPPSIGRRPTIGDTAVTIEWKAFWTAIGATVALALAVLTIADVIATFLTIVIAMALALIVWALSRVITDACQMWRSAEDWQQQRIWIGTTAAEIGRAHV